MSCHGNGERERERPSMMVKEGGEREGGAGVSNFLILKVLKILPAIFFCLAIIFLMLIFFKLFSNLSINTVYE